MTDAMKANIIRFGIVAATLIAVLALNDPEPVSLRCEYPVEIGEPLVIEREHDEYDPSSAMTYQP